jgi:hypothetical protein
MNSCSIWLDTSGLKELKFDFNIIFLAGICLEVFSFSSHKLWVEQPENFPTCLALKPYPKESSNQKIYFYNSRVADPDL